MDNFVWRYRARVVAYFGLLLSFVTEVYVVLVTIEALIGISKDVGKDVAVWMALLAVVLQNIIVGVQLWATVKLFSATKVGICAKEALKMSRIWLKVNLVVLVIGAVYKIFSIYAAIGVPESTIWIVAFVVVYLLYVIMMLIVFKFIQELERVTTFGSCLTETNSLVYEL